MTAVLPMMGTALGLAVLASGCVMSTDAVIAEADATLDDRLLGMWQETDGDDSAVVTRDSGNVYVIVYSSDIGTGTFAGRLGRLGGRQVMDFSPTPGKNEVPEAYENYLLPTHVLLTIDFTSDSLRVATLDCDSLRVALKEGRVKLAYGETRNRVMLHATGEQFRAAIAPYLAKPGSLTSESVWRKKPAISSADP